MKVSHLMNNEVRVCALESNLADAAGGIAPAEGTGDATGEGIVGSGRDVLSSAR